MYVYRNNPDHVNICILVLVPHVGTATLKTRNRMAKLAAENVLAGLEGTPLPTPAF